MTLALTLTIAASLTLTDADLLPSHLTTVWWDESCDCRRVVVEPLAGTETGPLAPGTLFVTAEAP